MENPNDSERPVVRIQAYATRAADFRREALRHVLRALLGDVGTQLPESLSTLFADFGSPDLATQADEVEQKLLDQGVPAEKNAARDRLRSSLRFLIEQLVPPFWKPTSIPRQRKSDLLIWLRRAPQVLERVEADTSDSVWVIEHPMAQAVVGRLEEADKYEKLARSMLTEVVKESTSVRAADGEPACPMLSVAEQVIQRHARKCLVEADELFQMGCLHLYKKIDLFHPSRGSFLAWWRKILSNLLHTKRRDDRRDGPAGPRSPVGDLPDSREGPITTTLTLAEENQALLSSFTDSDWATIRRWSEGSPDIPVVVLVGFGWVSKARANTDHWRKFCHWLNEFGVADIDSFCEELELADGTTVDQFQILTRHSGTPYNTIRNKFRRKFAGVQQAARQTSFGKCHLVVELDYFWEQLRTVQQNVPAAAGEKLRSLSVNSRVAALCCAPAWHLLVNKAEWKEQSAGYPFARVPPLLEFLRDDFDVDGVKEWARNTDVQAYVREQVLVHGTRGNFEKVRQSVRAARLAGAEVELTLRDWANGTGAR